MEGRHIPLFARSLLDLRSLWSKLDLPGDCPYNPSEEELSLHARQYVDFETMQELKMWLKASMQTTSGRAAYNERMATAKESSQAAAGGTGRRGYDG
ncbi:hypothetical protein AJ80_05761 [Polytolypa hystricis UAMH7299]|uniref:Uncharacterized protein n=1 Tax=Polytolypa hystricis (strain UAMH7299) TaxID=1447883 RepID=A0A2B7Y0W5_POLH7|nr:hypothetical protein AJ80_05761 [Polytolypa hystricis UAMH7299]